MIKNVVKELLLDAKLLRFCLFWGLLSFILSSFLTSQTITVDSYVLYTNKVIHGDVVTLNLFSYSLAFIIYGIGFFTSSANSFTYPNVFFYIPISSLQIRSYLKRRILVQTIVVGMVVSLISGILVYVFRYGISQSQRHFVVGNVFLQGSSVVIFFVFVYKVLVWCECSRFAKMRQIISKSMFVRIFFSVVAWLMLSAFASESNFRFIEKTDVVRWQPYVVLGGLVVLLIHEILLDQRMIDRAIGLAQSQ